MSSPTSTPRRTPKRTNSKRTPLQEQNPSQKNEAAGRLQRDSKPELSDAEIFSATPFPTKPQHVLLPSTIRKQRSRPNTENEVPSLFFHMAQPELLSSESSWGRSQDDRRVRRAPNLHLKKSVTALRDMYEAQAESSRPSTAAHSRPSTAAPSPLLRPASSRLRSTSSSEGLYGRNAWEMLGLPKVSSDDLSTLPTLSEHVQPLESEQSFASRVRNQAAPSRSNVETFGSSSSNFEIFEEQHIFSEAAGPLSSSDPVEAGTSSPNIVQLQQSSSFIIESSRPHFPESGTFDEGESSPNVVKLASTSPKRSSSPALSHASSTMSRKRKRVEMEGSAYAGRTPLALQAHRPRLQPDSPLQNDLADSGASLQSPRDLPSSPPEIESVRSQSQPTSSPVVRVHGGRLSTDRSSVVSAHTNLQSVLSSSPAPPIQRPIIKAPKIDQFETLALQKRASSGQSKPETSVIHQLSPVPSVGDMEAQQLAATDLDPLHPRRSASRVPAFKEHLEEDFDGDFLEPVQNYVVRDELNSSQDNILSDTDQNEATDELAALPKHHSSFAAALSHVRSASFLGSTSSSNSLSRLESIRSSMDDRLQSMRSFTNGRNGSFRSVHRPGSAGSYMSATVVPTWARRYYSGFYRNSFQYLYQSSSNLSYSVLQISPPSRPGSGHATSAASASFETISTRSKSTLRRSWSQSVRSSVKHFLPAIAIPPRRHRLNIQQSHNTAGIGPLVSNPVRPVTEYVSRPPSAYHNRQTVRRISMPLAATDPRYHWRGVIEEPSAGQDPQKFGAPYPTHSRRNSPSTDIVRSRNQQEPPQRIMRLPTPHLHHDRMLHSSSSASRGFGTPYNMRPRWQPTDGLTDDVGPPTWFQIDLRDLQVVCFMTGFLFPLAWFVGAFTHLPSRPSSYHDIEKMETATHQGQTQYRDLDEVDVLARLRLERHLRGLEEVKWQNARWWRRMNRWMCCVGLVVLVLVVVLAVIGTRSRW